MANTHRMFMLLNQPAGIYIGSSGVRSMSYFAGDQHNDPIPDSVVQGWIDKFAPSLSGSEVTFGNQTGGVYLASLIKGGMESTYSLLAPLSKYFIISRAFLARVHPTYAPTVPEGIKFYYQFWSALNNGVAADFTATLRSRVGIPASEFDARYLQVTDNTTRYLYIQVEDGAHGDELMALRAFILSQTPYMITPVVSQVT